MNKLKIIAKREFLQIVRKPTFWITTLALPVFFVVLGVVSGLSSQSAEDKLKQLALEAKAIYVIDKANVVAQSLVVPPLELKDDQAAAITAVRQGEIDAAIVYPEDFKTKLTIEIYLNSKGLLADNAYDEPAKQLVKQSVLAQLNNPELVKVFNSDYSTNVTSYKAGELTNTGFAAFIVPLVAVAVYFILVTFAASYLLQSVSEEKENRMIEIMLSTVSPKVLIGGKILGQVAVVLTQLVALLVMALVGLTLLSKNLNIDLSNVQITAPQVLWTLFFTICGFLFNANIMVGVGAAVPTFREAGSLSSVFIFAAIIPIYLAGSLIAEPSGSLALVFSYFPFTAPMILLFRNSLGELSLLEQGLGAAACILYVIISFVIAFKLFELGALEYHTKLSWKRLGSILPFYKS